MILETYLIVLKMEKLQTKPILRHGFSYQPG